MIAEPFDPDSHDRSHREMMQAMEAREQSFMKMAEQAFNAFVDYPKDNPKLEVHRDETTGKIILKNPQGEALDQAVSRLLNHRTIGYFVELALAHHETAKQTARAIKSHEANRAAKKSVFDWCDENMSRFSSMDDAALDIAETFVPQKFRTVREWMTEWKKLRSAGKP